MPAVLILPGFNFQMVDKTSGGDLFFSSKPAYSLNDIKVVFKTGMNKIDSIAPPQRTGTGAGQHFVYVIPFNKTADTCYIKIKNLKTDTVISTIAKVKTECSTNDVVIKVQVNKNTPVAYSNTDVVVIRK